MGSATAGRGTRRREIRVGLVMYGGVSRATYTYGVSREFLMPFGAAACMDC